MTCETCKTPTDDRREEFCGACVALPLAFIGAGASQYTSSKSSYKMKQRILFWGMMSTAVMLLITLWYYKQCDECV